ncbi:hypothetical protein ACS0TY_017905 [Phlomoides rotata]
MEKTPAACAMDWSIQLEKGIRSRKPGKSIAALEEIGRRFERWNYESELTVADYRVFGLIPGEDKLFLNAIFLRLVDAFRLGDTVIKKGIVKIFLRMRKGKKRDGEGILSKGKLDNHVEFLRRVKEVFDTGDVEERALSLLLFGCWACFSKDCVDIRYILLSSLVSDDVREVKAALFAAGCLSELSDDFANVFLELLRTMVLPQGKSNGIKLAGGRAFAKMSCSFSLAQKAYKTGLKFLMDSLEDEFSAVMLISLSRIASRWMLLIPSQIELLTLFQSEERSFHVQATSLRCQRFILGRGASNFPSTMGTVHKLFNKLHRSELQPTLQLEALRVLHKILLYNLSIIPCMEIPVLFQRLFIVVKSMLQSSIGSNRVRAISFLADLSGKILGRQDIVSSGTGRNLAVQLNTFVLDQIKPKLNIQQADFAAELEVKSLLNTLLNLVEKHPYLHCLVLNSICLFIDKLVKMLDGVDTEKTLLESKIILYLSKIVVACLQNLDTDAETSIVLDVLKLQAENVCRCSYIDSYTSVTYLLILHLHSTIICMRHTAEDLMSLSRELNLSRVHSILQLDKSTLDCAKKMLGRKSYWQSYKAGKTAACQGAWSTAAFIFEELMTVVQSSSCSSWLKSLSQFSNSEKQIQSFLIDGMGAHALKTNHCNTNNLLRACDTLLSAEKVLAASDMGHTFIFQRWFLTVRVKAMRTVIDMMKLLNALSSNQDSSILLSLKTYQVLDPFVESCMEVSCRMKKIAQEFDLLLTSFMGMDRQSVMSISALALSCSLMAFTAGFAFLVPNSHASENYEVFKSRNSGEPFHLLLVEDLVGRLAHIDCKTREHLLFLLKSFHNCNSSFSSRFKTQISSSYESIFLQKLCEYSVEEIFSSQNEAIRARRDGDMVYQILNSGTQLLLNIISKTMLIPFRTPHYFFRVRPSVSSELLIRNEDGQNVDESSILSGHPLSLYLSFQMKHMPAAPLRPPNKVYCILNCKPHLQTSKIGERKLIWQDDDEMDDMMALNVKLQRYAVGSVKKANGPHCRSQDKGCSMVTEYVCFELNERGGGLSTCFLNVSSLPVGSYRIKWHCGFIDRAGCYRNLLPVNAGPLFTVREATTA